MNPVFRTARRADEEDVPAPLMAVEHYDLGVFVDWVWDCNQERQALRAKVKELEADNSNLRLQCGGMQGDIVDLRADLVEAASILRRYETYHRDKGTEESIRKAEVNAALATRFELTLGRYGDAPA